MEMPPHTNHDSNFKYTEVIRPSHLHILPRKRKIPGGKRDCSTFFTHQPGRVHSSIENFFQRKRAREKKGRDPTSIGRTYLCPLTGSSCRDEKKAARREPAHNKAEKFLIAPMKSYELRGWRGFFGGGWVAKGHLSFDQAHAGKYFKTVFTSLTFITGFRNYFLQMVFGKIPRAVAE